MIIDTYSLVFTMRLIVRLTKINFLIARLIAIKNFDRTAALLKTAKSSYAEYVFSQGKKQKMVTKRTTSFYVWNLYRAQSQVEAERHAAVTWGCGGYCCKSCGGGCVDSTH